MPNLQAHLLTFDNPSSQTFKEKTRLRVLSGFDIEFHAVAKLYMHR